MSNSWIFDVETSIFAIVKTKSKANLINNYPNINYTMDDSIVDEPTFPTVYIHFLPSIENGSTLDGKDIHAILSTAQVEITVNKEMGMNGAREVAFAVLDEFKALRFNITSAPEFVGNTADTKRIVFRCRRMIGANDTI